MNFPGRKSKKQRSQRQNFPRSARFFRSLVIFVSLCGILPFLGHFALFRGVLIAPNENPAGFDYPAWLPPALYALAVLVTLWKQQPKALVYGLAFGHFVVLAHLLEFFNVPVHPGLPSIGAQIGFLWFALMGRFFSLGTLAFVIVLFFWEQSAPSRTAVAVLFSAIVIRYLVLAVTQNLSILGRLGAKRTPGMLSKTAFYWAPLLLFALPAYFATKIGYRSVTNAIYATADPGVITKVEEIEVTESGWEKFKKSFGEQVTLTLSEEKKSTEEVREDVLDRTWDFFNEAREDAKGSLVGIDRQTANNGRLLRKRLIDGFEAVVPTTGELGLEHQPCGVLELDCHAANIARSVVRGAYSSARSKARSRFERRLDQELKGPAKDLNTKVKAVQRTIEDEVNAVRDETILVLKRTFDAIDFLNLIFDLLFVFLCVKSFLYVFARVACSAKSPVDVTLRETPEERIPLGEILKWGSQYVINGDDPVGFYISRKFEPRGRPPKLAFPQFSAATFARFRSGSLGMNHIITGPGMDNVDFSAVNGAQFVEWLLVPGETVVFDPRNLVGFTDNLSISSLVSMRVTSLLMGRLIFPTATGPGRLILMANGEPTAGFEARTASSVTPNRLMAWHKTASFSVESEESFRDIYFSGFYLRKRQNDLVIVDADRIGKPGQGVGRFIKYFLLPW